MTRNDGDQRDVTETATQARQGNRGRPVLIVLIGGLLLALIAWVGLGIWGESIDTDAKPTASTSNDSINAQPSGAGTLDNAADGSARPPEKTDRSPSPSGSGGGPTQVTSPSGAEKIQ